MVVLKRGSDGEGTYSDLGTGNVLFRDLRGVTYIYVVKKKRSCTFGFVLCTFWNVYRTKLAYFLNVMIIVVYYKISL